MIHAVEAMLVVLVIVLWLGAASAAVAGTVDALGQPAVLWMATGYRRSVWIWQALGVLVIPAALVFSGWYFVRVRPRLTAARRALARPAGAETPWPDRPRQWRDRLSWARRSPGNWAKAARQWWIWAVLAVADAAFLLLWIVTLARPSNHDSRPLLYGVALPLVLTAIMSAARAGFWYAEHQRLTGRRPEQRV